MPHERIYHPETCEPFDVPASKASDLVLNKGWSRTPWTFAEPESPVEDEAPRGRGRRRRVTEEVAEDEPTSEIEAEAQIEDDGAELWRS